jgi:site-specific recombinase XerD
LQAVERGSGLVWQTDRHTLRHTLASRLAMTGVDLETVQELMGHKTAPGVVR